MNSLLCDTFTKQQQLHGTVTMTIKFLKFPTYPPPSLLQSKEDQTQVVSNLKTISMSSSKLLLAAKALSTDPSSPNLKNQLAAAARYEMFLLASPFTFICFYCLSVFYISEPVCPQGSDGQHQPAHHHVHSAGSGAEGV